MKTTKQKNKTKQVKTETLTPPKTGKTTTKKTHGTKALMARQLRWPMLVLLIAALAVVATILLTYEADYLFRVQELNLFLYTPLFLKQQLVTSGGVLTYIASYFTQFFYHTWIGVTMLCLWWALLMWVMKRTFNIPVQWALLLLIPVALLLLTDVDLGYWIYYLKLRGHFFVATIGTTVAVALAWAYRTLTEKFFLRTAFIVIAVAVGYPLLGFYSLLAALLMAVLAWRLDDYSISRRIIDTIVAITAGALIPIVYYHTVYYQTNFVNIYYTALPLYRTDDDYMIYYTPFYILVAVLVAFAVAYRSNRPSSVKRIFAWTAAQLALIAVITFGTWHFWYKNENFHTELTMYRAAMNQQWEDILVTYRQHDAAPSRIMWMTKNLALARLGRQGDEMYHYRNGDSAPDAPFVVRMAQCGGKLLYYNYGLLNYCYRWCMEDGVEYGWRIDYLIYMLKCSLINQELVVAKKYIDVLKQTKYYKAWAEQYEPYVQNPKLIQKDKELATIHHLLPPVNEITSDQSLVEIFLMNHFSAHDSNDPAFQEQAMIFALQTKDIQTFWSRFFRYANNMEAEHRHMPVHIQEAAYLYGHLEDKVDISNMPFDQEVIDTYEQFMATAQSYSNLTEQEMKPLMYDRFGGTFYYEYFFTRDQHSY